jgi:hypothetical protein
MPDKGIPVFIRKAALKNHGWIWVAGMWLAEGRWDGDVAWDPRPIGGFRVSDIIVEVIYRS